MDAVNSLFYIIILILSVVIHEVAHGYVAYRYGDMTAQMAGRLTMNPIKHIDLFGSIIVPGILLISGAGFVIGWAKPVPYNPDNFRDRKRGTIAVGFAGIIANFTIAIIFGILMRILGGAGMLTEDAMFITSVIVITNIVLGFFNLMPIPPLDGSRIIAGIGGYKVERLVQQMERYGLALALLFIFFIWPLLTPVIFHIFRFITGISFM
jgi:Zn-dependent protease